MDKKIEFAVIGGSGITPLFKKHEELDIITPYGHTSDKISILVKRDYKIAFISRHQKNHKISPDLINYRANIWALKELGVKRIIALLTIGSMSKNIKIGDFVIPKQFIDFTKNRKQSFQEKEFKPFSMSEPFCPQLRKKIFEEQYKVKIHPDGTYVCVQGPRFSTKMEGQMYKKTGADIIGMTLVPECVLAREVGMCYIPICVVTDSDNFSNIPVSLKRIRKQFSQIKENTNHEIEKLVSNLLSLEENCTCQRTR